MSTELRDDRLAAFCLARQVRVEKRGRAYILLSVRTDGPIAKLHLTDEKDKMRVLWWDGVRWRDPGPFGALTMSLDPALDYIASEPAFWIHA
ncbi:MAG TPA: hypothetical protein VEW25_13805 [Allosphingosinicella sp.]|nr:hypothetical protein [Allosphingosinicella sp.]